MNVFKNMKLSVKLFTGFGLVCFVLAAAVLLTMLFVGKANVLTDRVIELRAPTAKLGVELQNGLNYSLATLRGYMLLGADKFKTGRAQSWDKQINPALERMTVLSKSWTVEANKKKLERMRELFAKLQVAQEEIEKISGTVENLPAQKMLIEKAAPRAAVMSKEITAMINEELTQESTDARKALLGMMADVRGTLGLGLANIRAYLLTGDGKFRKGFDKLWAKNTKRFGDLGKNQSLLTSTQAGAFKRFSTARKIFVPLPPKMFEIRGGIEWNLANRWLGTKAAPVAAELNTIITAMIENQAKLMDKDSGAAKKATATLTQLLWILLAIGLVVSSGVAVVVTRSISKPVGKVTETAQYIAKGDLNQTIDIDQTDEIGMLAKSFQGLMETLRDMVAETKSLIQAAQDGKLDIRGNATKFEGAFAEIIGGVNEMLDVTLSPVKEAGAVLEKVAARDLTVRVEGDYKGDHAKIKDALNTAVENLDQGLQQVAVGAEQVSSASGQISTGSQSLAQGTSEQASSLEEVSSNLQEMTSMTKQNSSSAKEARGMADGARTSAGKGVESMKGLSEAIDRMKASADETAKIVKTIDEIAFQTNLLALNAAVEAARAGDAGKGFAVVAEEVRNLAIRSAEAAKNTANMIEESVKNAEGGVSINKEVLKNLEEISGQVDKVSEVMGEIAAASDQQTQGVDQITTAVEQMNQVTQQTAANSEESASAAEELSGQAEEMRSMVTSFQLSSTNGAAKHVRVHKTDEAHPVQKPVVQQKEAARVVALRPTPMAGHTPPMGIQKR